MLASSGTARALPARRESVTALEIMIPGEKDRDTSRDREQQKAE
jgi:hypothetical protein